ncbi:IS3 family transposase [Aneurinibacillus migulanus]|uniref:IS3 family transposase n=1 Tax=Aneurinibacillus migulanus TaxID=47500 RepID=UPI0009BC64D0|nr:IS3 family transposase [Aneurinibacillus migulanus]
MCAVLNISRSGYYAWATCKESEPSKRRNRLEVQIRRVFLASRRLYGSPKVTQILRQQGVQVSEKTVACIMKELGLKSCTVKKYKATTNSRHNLPVYDNVLAQKFSVVENLYFHK